MAIPYPSDEQLKKLGEVLFFALIIPFILYYIWQGVKFCFNFLFGENNSTSSSQDESGTANKNSIGLTNSIKPTEPQKNLENQTNQEEDAVYALIDLNTIESYPKPTRSFLTNFFSSSPPSPPTFTERLLNTFSEDTRRSMNSRLDGCVFSTLDEAKQKLNVLLINDKMMYKDRIIVKFQSNPSECCTVVAAPAFESQSNGYRVVDIGEEKIYRNNVISNTAIDALIETALSLSKNPPVTPTANLH